ncbi:hypothetical protein ACWFMI_25060 [Nocardiopsis terrae]|uniref:hypothetical protein n=1 Tax=Streptomyces sp. NPDC057554 TaxID=3350538 RepID=UPI0036C9163E
MNETLRVVFNLERARERTQQPISVPDVGMEPTRRTQAQVAADLVELNRRGFLIGTQPGPWGPVSWFTGLTDAGRAAAQELPDRNNEG